VEVRGKRLRWTDCNNRRADEAVAAEAVHRPPGRRQKSADGDRTAAASQSRAPDGAWKRDV